MEGSASPFGHPDGCVLPDTQGHGWLKWFHFQIRFWVGPPNVIRTRADGCRWAIDFSRCFQWLWSPTEELRQSDILAQGHREAAELV